MRRSVESYKMETRSQRKVGVAQCDQSRLEEKGAILDREALQGGFERENGAIEQCGQQPSGSSDKIASATTQKFSKAQGGHTTSGRSWTPFLTGGANSDREAGQGGYGRP
jgi:hypothetical protein